MSRHPSRRDVRIPMLVAALTCLATVSVAQSPVDTAPPFPPPGRLRG